MEAFENIETEVALDFLKQYPTPAHLSALKRKEFNRFATQQHHLSKQRCEELWEKLQKPQLGVPEHVVRAKAQLVEVLIEQLRASIKAVKIYNHKVESFFASSPAAAVGQDAAGREKRNPGGGDLGRTGRCPGSLGILWPSSS